MFTKASDQQWLALKQTRPELVSLQEANNKWTLSSDADSVDTAVFCMVCRLGQEALEALRLTKRTIRYFRSRLGMRRWRLLLERTPWEWITRFDDRRQGFSSSVEVQRACDAVEALSEHRNALERVISICNTCVSRYRSLVRGSDAYVIPILVELVQAIHILDPDVVVPQPNTPASALIAAVNSCDSIGECIWGTAREWEAPGLSRHWLSILGFGVLTGAVLVIAFRHRTALASAVTDARAAVANLWRDRIATPLQEMYRTARYSERQFPVASPGALQAERESLARMVNDFLQKRAGGAEYVPSNDGDLTRVMPYYEEAIRNPLRNAIRGDLIQLLLIQIQRAKSDVALSLASVDHMISANEINFQVMSTIPILLVGYWTFTSVRSLLLNRGRGGPEGVRRSLGRALLCASKGLDKDKRRASYLSHIDAAYTAFVSLRHRDQELVERTCCALAWDVAPHDVSSVVMSLSLQSKVFSLA